MKLMRFAGATLAVGAILALGGCGAEVEDIDRTQPNALKKELFQGEWYFARTVVDVPYESTASFIGDRQEFFFQEDFPAIKIRWRIEEGRLMACRADEVVLGGNSQGQTPGDEVDPSNAEARAANDAEGKDWRKFPCNHPVAAFKINSHFDIIRDYNAQTGEQSNVIRENTVDRPWHERDYFRIDWTDIGVKELSYNITSMANMGWYKIDAPYYIQEEAGDCRVANADGSVDYSSCEEGFVPPIIDDESILLTNRMTVTPSEGLIGCAYGWNRHCALSELGIRYSFKRVPERPKTEQYETLYYPDKDFERYGFWRVVKSTYVDGRGETDFKQFLATRWQIWQETHSCNGDECTPLPLDQRKLKPITYHLNRGFPVDLKRTAFEIAKAWNDAFDGISPSEDVVNGCKVECNDGTPMDQCQPTDNWYMTGTCAFVLKENSGEEFLGDLRYNFIAWIEDPGQGQPCGVGGPANDPETGELINAVSYVYGAGCFDWLSTALDDQVAMLCAQKEEAGEPLPTICDCEDCGLDENAYIRGENVLEIMQAQGYVQPPRRAIRYRTPTGSEFASDGMARNLEPRLQRFAQMNESRGLLQTRAARFYGSATAKALIPNELALEISGGRTANGADLTEDELSLANPLNPQSVLRGTPREALRDRMTARAVEPAEFLFNERGLAAFVEANKDLTREEFRQLLRQETFRSTTLHELGHNMGLRHNFIASFDRANYHPEYWRILADARQEFEDSTGRDAPEFDPFQDDDETDQEFFDRYAQWEADRDVFRGILAKHRVREYRSSSIMDYGGLWYSDWKGLGSYDKGAMRFLYANLVDRIRGGCAGNTPEACLNKLHDREWVQWYRGGERCASDSDCPSTALGQTCRIDDFGTGYCSNWDDDESSRGYNPRFQFCSDERVADQPFCNRFDEGESSEEIVRNMIEMYERGYVRLNFRRYRANFSGWSYFRRIFTRYFTTVGDQMQSLMYKYYYEPGFRQKDGPGGFEDMFRATVIGFDFLGNVLARPDAGSYEWNEALGVYEHNEERLVDNPGSEYINIPLGQGKPVFSSYETGYFGETSRLSYIGTFYDKLGAIWTLTLRDWGSSALANEQRFLLSFYDFFPGAFTRLLGASIIGDRQQIGMAYDRDTDTLHEMTFWDGNFFGDDEGWNPDTINPNFRRIESGMGLQMSQYALIYSMIYTPVFFDLSFINATRVFEMGGQTGFDVDGLDPDDVNSCTTALSNRTFVAVKTNNVRHIGWDAIDKCKTLNQRYLALGEAIETGVLPEGMTMNEAERDYRTLENDVASEEDRLSNMVFLSDRFGIGGL